MCPTIEVLANSNMKDKIYFIITVREINTRNSKNKSVFVSQLCIKKIICLYVAIIAFHLGIEIKEIC